MTDTNHDLLDIVTQIRSHLEYLQALGVRHIEVAPPHAAVANAVSAERTASVPMEPPALREPVRTAPSTPAKTSDDYKKAAEPASPGTESSAILFEGSSNAAILFIGELSGRGDKKSRKPFEGPDEKLLNDIIEKGMKLKRADVSVCAIAVQEARELWETELRSRLKQMKPRVIVSLGSSAAKALLNSTEDIETLRGKWRTYEGIPLMPTYDPSRMLQNPQDKKPVWDDIQLVMGKLKNSSQ